MISFRRPSAGKYRFFRVVLKTALPGASDHSVSEETKLTPIHYLLTPMPSSSIFTLLRTLWAPQQQQQQQCVDDVVPPSPLWLAAVTALGSSRQNERSTVSFPRQRHFFQGRRLDRGLLLETRKENTT